MNLSVGARIGCGAAAIGAAGLLLSMAAARPGTAIVAVIWGVGVLAAVRPFDGLLVVAGVGPVITALAIALGSDHMGVRFPEALALSFIAGAAARRAASGQAFAVRLSIAIPALILVAAAIVSAGISASVLGIEQPAAPAWAGMPIFVATEFLTQYNGAIAGVQFAEGLVLFLLAADLCSRRLDRREQVLAMMIAGVAGAACLNVARLVTAALAREDSLRAFASFLITVRVNVLFKDWNAAGSIFAMTLLIAVAFLGRRRWWYLFPAAIIATALWITGSRAAMAAVLVAAAGAGLFALRRRESQRRMVIASALLLIAGTAALAWHFYPRMRNDPAAFSVKTRLELWRAGVSMMSTQPIFGIGIGGFYAQSHRYAPEMLNSIWRPHENAHNYFIQVLAELGIPGLLLFVTLIGLSLREAWRAGNAWWTTGVIAFLLSCVVGHPLIVPEASYPFWIALSVAASATNAAPLDRRPNRPAGLPVLVAAVILAASVPMRLRDAARHANTENTSLGLSAWQTGSGGIRYRWAAPHAMFYVPSGARGVRIPLRSGPDAPPELEVRLLYAGREAERILLHREDDWRFIRLIRTQLGTDADFSRIDLKFAPPSGASPTLTMLMVGQPTLVWVQ